MVLTIPEKREYKGAIVDERQWIHAIRKGNKEPLEDIAEKYYDDIWRFCAFQTGSREDAYDLAQETFVRFIRYVESYHERNLKGYLLTIARNVCRDYLRRKHRETTYMWYNGGCLPEEGYRKAPEPTAGTSGQRAYGNPERPVYGSPGRRMYGNPERHVYGNPEQQVYDSAEQPLHGSLERRMCGNPEQYVYDSPERHAVDADIHDRLMQALAQLPQMQREAILLHYLYDMKYREIGRVTDAQVSTVKSRVRQGMEKLQGILRREDFLD